jgi:cytochrome c-type biogenesis protein CcmH/NrfG
VAAAVDWVWELAVIPAAFLLIAGALLAGPLAESRATQRGKVGGRRRRRRVATTVVLAALALPALAVIAISLAGAASVRDSQAEARSAQLVPALDHALDAEDVQPYAASASLQKALVLELGGDLDGAAAAAREATREEATNWRTWLTLSRIEAENGNARASVDAYREARSLNPTSPVFGGGE